MISRQEEKFAIIVKTLEEAPTEQLLFTTFLKMYPGDWRQLKIVFSKFKQSKQSGKTIPLPKPEQYLRKSIRVWLQKQGQ